MKPEDVDSQAAAVARVRAALDLIQEAQNCLGRAQEELSPIIGGHRQWKALGTLYRRVHAQWYNLSDWLRQHSTKIDLDTYAKALSETEGKENR